MMKSLIKKIFQKKWIFVSFCTAVGACLLCLSLLLVTNIIVVSSTSDNILSPTEAAELSDVDCILVLGCGLRSDSSPSDMLYDRLEQGISLYFAGSAPKLLMSGDHGRAEYDEVNAMKSHALSKDVPARDIFMDHAGFSTYESMYRAKEIFGANKIIIVTQGYHLYRALYIARSLGIEAYGVAADLREYRGEMIRGTREALARTKDIAYTLIKPRPTYLGEPISLMGDGNITNG